MEFELELIERFKKTDLREGSSCLLGAKMLMLRPRAESVLLSCLEKHGTQVSQIKMQRIPNLPSASDTSFRFLEDEEPPNTQHPVCNFHHAVAVAILSRHCMKPAQNIINLGRHQPLCDCFYELGVRFVSVLAKRALVFGVHIRAHDF